MTIVSEKIDRGNSGLTLLELIVTIGIGTFVVLAALTLQRDVLRLSNSLRAVIGMQEEARRSLHSMSTQIRAAASAKNGSYPIAKAEGKELAFYSDTDNDGETELVRYFVMDGNLYVGLTEPSGLPAVYLPGQEDVSELARNLSDEGPDLFEYYDESYDGTSQPLAEPFEVSDVRLIRISITVDHNGDIPPGPQTYETQISIRNLKDNL